MDLVFAESCMYIHVYHLEKRFATLENTIAALRTYIKASRKLENPSNVAVEKYFSLLGITGYTILTIVTTHTCTLW